MHDLKRNTMKPFQIILRTFSLSLIFFLILFISAGRINYWQGWLYVAMNILMTLMTMFSSRGNKELISERFKPGQGTKNWDKMLLGFSSLIYIAMLIIAGLDSGRFKWSPDLHPGWYLTGVFLTLAGHTVFLIAKRQNRFFSTVVRIQTERGHTVCDTGLYKIVRHPGYLGMIVANTGFPLMLGSLFCIIPVVVTLVLIVIRTQLEDKTLVDELTGYSEYTLKTPGKLIPKIW